jgi:peptidoglycan-associated lipoprotein
MKKVLITLIIALVAGISTYAQRNFAEEADKKFNTEQYYDAIPLYKKAYTKVTKNRVERTRILFQVGVCYRMINDARNSESTFKRVIAAKYPDPLVYLYYADALKANEKFEEAAIQYAEYKKLAPDDPRGDIGLESCKMALQWRDNPTRYEVEINKKMNSRANDFAPTYADRKYRSVVFTTARDEVSGKGTDAWTGQPFTDLFIIELDRRGNWSNPQPLDDTGELNSPHNEGASAFNDKFNTLYFTRCEVVKKQRAGCQIYTSSKRGRGWGNVELIAVPGTDSATVGHPAVTSDELTIYFASDMPGGYGGRDIWMMQRPRKNRPFEAPVNLGPVINTPGDELYPTLREDNILYFSSNYHPGLGGLDIFRSDFVDGQWTTPQNMMVPINSTSDDFHIVFNKDAQLLKEANAKEMGFFSSNRKGGRGGDDIWMFKLPPILFTLSGIVYDDSTKQVLSKAIVQIVETSDGNVYVDTTDEKGFYKFNEAQILENTSYVMEVTRVEYFNEKGRETTVGLNKSTDLVRDFYLVPVPIVPIELPEIRYLVGLETKT